MQEGCDYKGHLSCQVSVRKIITTVVYYRDWIRSELKLRVVRSDLMCLLHILGEQKRMLTFS